MQPIVIVVELVLLAFLSQRLTQSLYNVFFLLFRVRSVAISIVTLILFPGTVIHELAHLFTAEVLGVRTGKITLTPESIRGEEIQSGSVAIAQTDPIRRTLIGLAPTNIGLVALTTISYFLAQQLFYLQAHLGNIFGNPAIYLIILFVYILCTISITMFPSSVDLKGTPAVLITIFLFCIAAYIVGFRVAATGKILDISTSITTSLIQSLMVVLAVDIILLLINHLVVDIIGKLTHRRIIK